MKFTISLAFVAAAAYARSSDDAAFMDFCANNNKHYRTADSWRAHQQRWRDARDAVDGLNAKGSRANFAVNFFADLDEEERKQHLGLGHELPPRSGSGNPKFHNPHHGRHLNDWGDINWATAGHTTPIKDQGYCGSCTCFAATSAMEAIKSIHDTANNGGVLVPPVNQSEQQGLDCTDTTCNQGGW